MRYFLVLAATFFSVISSAQSWVDKVRNVYKDSIKSYGIVALVDNGKTKHTTAVGDSHDGQPISAKNRFCIGSASKMFTAALILKLHEQHKLDIQARIATYLPPHPFIDSNITIKQLLNHTSGITDFTKNDFVNHPLQNPFKDYSDSFILSLLDTVDFVSGSHYSYSNTNYFLLRKIIEVVTDRPYEETLREMILEPLHMKNTYPYYSSQIEGLAHPIINGIDLHSISKLGTNTISRGAGNIVSDVYDLNIFTRALLIDKKILKPATLALMTDFQTWGKNKVGLGLFSESYGHQTLWGHTGRQISYVSFAFANPSTGHSYIVLCNNANDDYAEAILERLCEADKN